MPNDALGQACQNKRVRGALSVHARCLFSDSSSNGDRKRTQRAFFNALTGASQTGFPAAALQVYQQMFARARDGSDVANRLYDYCGNGHPSPSK